MTKIPNRLHKYVPSMLLFLLFEAVAVTLWLTKDNFFYLLNFSYIGACLGLGTALFTAGKRYARHFVQLAVGSYMLLYLGVISRENMQIEGFWYYLFLGVFEAATIHYAVAKNFRTVAFWAWLVRLRLLDSYGAGLSALQSAAEATKRKAGLPSLCDVSSVSGVGVWAVSDAGGTFWSKSCSGFSWPEMRFITLSVLCSPSCFKITGHSASTCVPLRFFSNL